MGLKQQTEEFPPPCPRAELHVVEPRPKGRIREQPVLQAAELPEDGRGRRVARVKYPTEYTAVGMRGRNVPSVPVERPFEGSLRLYRKEQRRVQRGLARTGFVLRGTIALRRLPCGKPGCRCRANGTGHGPYYQITWQEGGKTVSRFLAPNLVPLYRAWISNDRALRKAMNRMLAVSRKAADAVRTEESVRAKGSKRP